MNKVSLLSLVQSAKVLQHSLFSSIRTIGHRGDRRFLIATLLICCSWGSFAQSKLIQRGPFTVTDKVDAIYGSNDRLLVLSEEGIWYTDDRATWTKTAQDFFYPSKFTKDLNGNLYVLNPSIAKSTDNGETWRNLEFSVSDDVTGDVPRTLYIYDFGISRDTLFFGSSNGIGYLIGDSQDAKLIHEFVETTIMTMAVDGNRIAAGDNEGNLHLSRDRGASWTSIKLPFGLSLASQTVMTGEKIFMKSYVDDLWYSNDFGTTWSTRNSPMIGEPTRLEVANGKFYASGNSACAFSVENDSWTEIGTFNELNTIAANEDHVFVAGAASDVYQGTFKETTNGGDLWIDITLSGYTSGDVFSLAMDGDSTIYAATTTGIYKKTKGASVFEMFIGKRSDHFLLDGDYIFIGYGSEVQGYNKDTGFPGPSYMLASGVSFVEDIVRFGEDLVVDTKSDGLWLIEKDGDLVELNNGLPSKELSQLQSDDGKLYVICNNKIYKLSATQTWQKVKVTNDLEVITLLANGNNILGSGSSLIVSHDGGITWNAMEGAIKGSALVSFQYGGGRYYAGDYLGRILISEDGGNTWLAKETLKPERLTPVSILPTKDSVYIGTRGKGIWSFKRLKLQKVTFDPIPPKIVGDAPFTITATSSEGLPVTFTQRPYSEGDPVISISSNVVTILGPGVGVIDATQEGNSEVDAAPRAVRSFCINYPKPTITTSIADNKVVLTSSRADHNAWYKDGQLYFYEGDAHAITLTEDGVYELMNYQGGCTSEHSDPVVITIAGLEDAADGISIFPNPAKDEIFFKTPQPVTITFIDVTGRVMGQHWFPGNSNHRVEISSLPDGLYFVKIQVNDHVTTKRFSKQ